jgi:Na+/H+-dicarboxylate symporter
VLRLIKFRPSSIIAKKSFNPYKSITGSVTNLETPFSTSTVRGTLASTKSLMNHKVDFNYSKNIAKLMSNKGKT